MLRRTLLAVAAASALGTSAFALGTSAFAQGAQFGTAAEAKAMLEKAIASVKADKTKALAAFNAGTDGFKDRDLYPFCANAGDGVMTAHPVAALRGTKLQELKDKAGKTFGEEMYKTGSKEGTISEVAYMWTRPGSDAPVQKVSYVTKIADQICGVGYYK